jgi:hypothetical protein
LKLHEDKIGKAEFQEREEKFNPNHYYALFNDMKKLVDEQSLTIEDKVNQFAKGNRQYINNSIKTFVDRNKSLMDASNKLNKTNLDRHLDKFHELNKLVE